MTQCVACGSNSAILFAFPLGSAQVPHWLLQSHSEIFSQKRSVVPRAKASSLPHYITRCWWKLNIGEYLLLITLHYHLVVLLMLQHLSKSKEVFLPAAVLHRPRWHKGRGAQVARARAPAPCSVHHQSCFLQHWDTAVQTNTATQRWQIPSCSKLYWKLRALKHPYPWATKHPSY